MKIVFRILAALLPTASVNDIVGLLAKFSENLIAAEKADNARIDAIEEEIASLNVEKHQRHQDGLRARRIADRLSGLAS